MGKVGSTSLWHALEDADQTVYFLHIMDPQKAARSAQLSMSLFGHKRAYHLVRAEVVNRRIVQPGKPARFIALTRDPIARNLSAFFQTYIVQTMHLEPTPPLSEICARFLESFDHDRPITFFDIEYKGMLGVDVFQEPFDPERGYVELSNGPTRALVMRLESGRSVIEEATARFLDLPGLSLPNKNVSREKPLGDLYKRFISEIKLPAEYIDRLIESRYTRHFYSEAERIRMAEHWTRHPR